MDIFRNVSIKQKLTAISILPSTLALLTAVLIFFIFDEISLKNGMVQELSMLSQVIGANNRAALMFNDRKSASDNLAVLSTNPHVISGCIFTSNGDLFACYDRKNGTLPMAHPSLAREGYYFDDNALSLVKKIEVNNATIGAVYLRYDLDALHARRNGYLALAAMILLLVSGLVLLLSSWLKKTISNPVLGLTETAKTITHDRDYSIRASGQAHGEFGILVQCFNEMLAQIQDRDARLARYRDSLEQEVAARTAELKASNDNLRTQMEENAKIEEELFRTRQLESLGILAGGIAHDFNNLLAAIIMNAGLAKIFISPDDKAFTRLEGIENACLRAKDLTMQLLTFSKGGAPITKIASITDLIVDSATFVFRGSKALCSFDIDKDLWPVEVDKGQISQVIQNLAINANQAMPDGGTALISGSNIVIDQDSRLNLKQGRYVRISVRDSGVGIPKEHLVNIFTPYFTTKKSGSGLGLATSYSIVSKHFGLITVESEAGSGTTFHVYLPASANELPETENITKSEMSGFGRVLVMDDDEFVQQVTGEALLHAGYKVGYARCGAEAIEMYLQARTSDTPYDVIIMDLTIPGGMGGEEAIKKLLDIDPNTKAIAASGYSQGSVMSDFKAHGFCGVLAKPFGIDELCNLVESVIHNGG